MDLGRGRNLLYFIAVALVMLIALALMIAFFFDLSPRKPKDPHEGQVYLYDGKDWIWMTPLEGVPVNTMTAEHFASEGPVRYLGRDYDVLRGIDVSEHQGEIDWETVADAGYGFVFVRVGFRGYGEEGTLNEDTMAVEYLQEAEKAGLQVGAYFFSQAINEEEAAEEAQFAADIVKKSGVTLDLPLVYDPEFAPYKGGRANYLTGKQVCKNTDAFRDAAEKAIKCKVALYTNLYWENNMFDAETLNEYEIWYADYEDVPDTPYHFTWWQYSESAAVPGIKGEMDLNLWIRRMD